MLGEVVVLNASLGGPCEKTENDPRQSCTCGQPQRCFSGKRCSRTPPTSIPRSPQALAAPARSLRCQCPGSEPCCTHPARSRRNIMRGGTLVQHHDARLWHAKMMPCARPHLAAPQSFQLADASAKSVSHSTPTYPLGPAPTCSMNSLSVISAHSARHSAGPSQVLLYRVPRASAFISGICPCRAASVIEPSLPV